MGYTFTAVNIHADESFPASLTGGDIPLYIAKAKARAYQDRLQEDELLITADTIVWVGDEDGDRATLHGEQLGKPKDEEDAARMLRMLSGRTHQVFTAVCLMTKDTLRTFVDRTDVTFRELTEDEIWHYIRTYRPLDKAGAYGIQEWIGYVACTALHGSYFNVVGLPTERLYEALQQV